MKISLENILFIIILFILFNICVKRNSEIIIYSIIIFIFFIINNIKNIKNKLKKKIKI